MLEAFAALTKAVLYGALLSAAGIPLAAASLRPSAAIRDYAMRVMRLAAVAAIALNVGIAALLFVRLGGTFDQPTLAAVFSSGPAAALVLQLTGAALLLAPADDDASGRIWRISAALTMTASGVFNGHAAAMSPAAGLLAMVHVTAASWWLGSLWLLRHACMTAGPEDLVTLVSKFSALAMRVVAGLIVTGVVLIVALVDFDSSPWATDYVNALVVKLAFVTLVLGIAIYNKVRLTPQLPRETQNLRRSITAEFAVIAFILMATAVLTTYFAPES